MATQKPTSSTDRALWMIALSLAIIATCLVLLVIRQNLSVEKAAAQPPPARIQTKVETETSRHIPAIARPKSSHSAVSDQETANMVPERVQSEPLSTPEPAVIPVVAKEELVSSTGLAPLTFLGTNNPTMITGRVTLKGTPPPETRIELDAVCGKLHQTPITTHRYVVSKNGGLANVLVYIESDEVRQHVYDGSLQPVVLNQAGCEFQPPVLALMAGQELIITNSDRLLHNVRASPLDFSGVILFNKAEAGGASMTHVFGTQDFVRIKCDVHPWMHAYLGIFNHTLFAKTDTDGSFNIPNTPPGKYHLTALHIQSRLSQTQEIVVREGKTTVQDFVIEVEKRISKIER